jgi:hypothetical protein
VFGEGQPEADVVRARREVVPEDVVWVREPEGCGRFVAREQPLAFLGLAGRQPEVALEDVTLPVFEEVAVAEVVVADVVVADVTRDVQLVRPVPTTQRLKVSCRLEFLR